MTINFFATTVIADVPITVEFALTLQLEIDQSDFPS